MRSFFSDPSEIDMVIIDSLLCRIDIKSLLDFCKVSVRLNGDGLLASKMPEFFF